MITITQVLVRSGCGLISITGVLNVSGCNWIKTTEILIRSRRGLMSRCGLISTTQVFIGSRCNWINTNKILIRSRRGLMSRRGLISTTQVFIGSRCNWINTNKILIRSGRGMICRGSLISTVRVAYIRGCYRITEVLIRRGCGLIIITSIGTFFLLMRYIINIIRRRCGLATYRLKITPIPFTNIRTPRQRRVSYHSLILDLLKYTNMCI